MIGTTDIPMMVRQLYHYFLGRPRTRAIMKEEMLDAAEDLFRHLDIVNLSMSAVVCFLHMLK